MSTSRAEALTIISEFLEGCIEGAERAAAGTDSETAANIVAFLRETRADVEQHLEDELA